MRMREPILTPEQAAAARRATMQERERLHAAAEERRELILQVMAGKQHSALQVHLQTPDIAKSCIAAEQLWSDIYYKVPSKDIQDAVGTTMLTLSGSFSLSLSET